MPSARPPIASARKSDDMLELYCNSDTVKAHITQESRHCPAKMPYVFITGSLREYSVAVWLSSS